jgi:RHS repeat-associated protein
MATTLGTLNPLRYRGYVYDTETGFYYLQSRYYDPQIGRFLNADAYASTGQGLLGNNMFAYCLNNPICRIDIGGAVSAKCLDYDEDLINEAPGTDDIGPGGGNRYINNDTFYSSLYNTANKYDISPNQRVVNSGMVQRGEYVIYNSWQSAEQGMRVSMGSANDYYSRTFSTGEGNRVVDGYNQSTEVIGESKYGYQSLSAFIRSEIERDAMLLLTSKVKAVEWHFYYSVVSGSIGGSYNLICALDAAGITVIYHY